MDISQYFHFLSISSRWFLKRKVSKHCHHIRYAKMQHQNQATQFGWSTVSLAFCDQKRLPNAAATSVTKPEGGNETRMLIRMFRFNALWCCVQKLMDAATLLIWFKTFLKISHYNRFPQEHAQMPAGPENKRLVEMLSMLYKNIFWEHSNFSLATCIIYCFRFGMGGFWKHDVSCSS